MALQMRARNQVQGQKAEASEPALSPEVKQLTEKCETIYDLFVSSMCLQITSTEQGQRVMDAVIQQAIQQIRLYRLEFLSNQELATSLQSETRKGKVVALKNHQEMFRVKSLIRMLNDCSGFAANEQSNSQIIQTI